MPATEEEVRVISKEQADKYLKIYNAVIDWTPHINELFKRLFQKLGEEQARQEMYKIIACATLLPVYEKNTIQDPPQNLLFYCQRWNQYTSRDWVEEYFKIVKQDEDIQIIRNKCLELGIVFRYEYNPNTRQAFNWLYEEASKSGDLTDGNREDIVQKLKNVVFAYGGVVVCSIFQKPELEYKIKKIPNWRSGYFFERLIHEVYKEDEILKIKTHELNKIRNIDPKLIKMIKTSKD